MTSDADPVLETDHLEQLLETPVPAQPVVVVQYRDRGVPTWVFFPLVLVVPAVALFVYDRTVVKQGLSRAEADRSFLERRIKEERALLPIERDTSSSKAVLPVPAPDAGSISPGEASVAAVKAAAPANASVKTEDKAAAQLSSPPTSVAVSPSAPGSLPTRPGDSTASPVADGKRGPGTSPNATAPVVAGSTNPSVPLEHKTATNSVQAGVRDPFDDLEKGRSPFDTDDAPAKTSSVGPQGPESESGGGPNRGPVIGETPGRPRDGAAINGAGGVAVASARPGAPASSADKPTTGSEVANGDRPIGPQALKPLPTKEETERSIKEEADRRAAQLDQQLENRDIGLRTERLAEQLKFREELRDLLKAKGARAGSDIAQLHHRYDFEVDPEAKGQAWNTWRFARKSMRDKLRIARDLGLPETTILQFMCASLDHTIGTRNGPRDHFEVWVRAAEQLLGFEPPQVKPRPRSGNAESAGAAPALRKVVSTPRN